MDSKFGISFWLKQTLVMYHVKIINSHVWNDLVFEFLFGVKALVLYRTPFNLAPRNLAAETSEESWRGHCAAAVARVWPLVPFPSFFFSPFFFPVFCPFRFVLFLFHFHFLSFLRLTWLPLSSLRVLLASSPRLRLVARSVWVGRGGAAVVLVEAWVESGEGEVEEAESVGCGTVL